MGESANFCGDALRLTTYLRVVEKQVPQRPKRFRARNIGEKPVESVPVIASDVSDAHNFAEAEVDDHQMVDPQSQESLIASAVSQPIKSKKRLRTSSHQKRRIAVKSLPLIRTTTSIGLPHLSKTKNALNEFPFHESAVAENASVLETDCGLRTRVVVPDQPLTRQKLAKHAVIRLRADKVSRKALSRSKSPSRKVKFAKAKRIHSRYFFEADAFEGVELSTDNMHKDLRNETPTRRSKQSMTRPLISKACENAHKTNSAVHHGLKSREILSMQEPSEPKVTGSARSLQRDALPVESTFDKLSLATSSQADTARSPNLTAPPRMALTYTESKDFDASLVSLTTHGDEHGNYPASFLSDSDVDNFSDEHFQMTPEIESSCVEVTVERPVMLNEASIELQT